MNIKVWTDGACKSNGTGGRAGWGVLFRFKDKEYAMSGFVENGTNNIGEMTAAIKALQAIDNKKLSVELISDSQYVIKGCTEWKDGWIRKNYKDVKNSDLWRELHAEVEKFNSIVFKFVRGHNGDYGNEIVDKLASSACYGKTQELKPFF